jgi:cell division protein FtsW
MRDNNGGRGAGRGRGGRGTRGTRGSASRGQEKTIFGVPERFMRPRIVLIVVTAILVCFGALMIYSASSVTCLASSSCNYDAAFYLKKQLKFAVVGVAAAFLISRVDYRELTRNFVNLVWIATVAILLMVFLPGTGSDAYGASRWISIFGFNFQPSEFAKITILMVAADLGQRYFDEHTLGDREFVKSLLVGVGVPILMILVQPDKGSTMILCATILVMAYLGGLDNRYVVLLIVAGVLGFTFLSLKDEYSRSRILTMLNPWSDPLDKGYQLIHGFYAFGSGGLFGVGIGFSKQKYSYLPMAHNDFIFAIIGEECGLVGALGMLCGFAVFAWAGFRIARYAPDLSGRLLAAGCTSMIIIQLFVNICGVLGVLPMTGKPIPFISYGGSSILASLMLVGVILSVSRQSRLPETDHDEARRSLQVAGSDAYGDAGLSFVGEATPRSARRAQQPVSNRTYDAPRGRSGFTMVSNDGSARSGRSGVGRSGRASRAGRTGASAGSDRRRIDLGPSATERLRGRDNGPRTRR